MVVRYVDECTAKRHVISTLDARGERKNLSIAAKLHVYKRTGLYVLIWQDEYIHAECKLYAFVHNDEFTYFVENVSSKSNRNKFFDKQKLELSQILLCQTSLLMSQKLLRAQ